MDSGTVLLHSRLNVRKVHHSPTSSSRPSSTAFADSPTLGIISASASNASISSGVSGNDGANTAAEDFGNWPLTWVALNNNGSITLYNPASRKTSVFPLEGAVAVWDPWFYTKSGEDDESGDFEVPKDAPGCWHLWLPSPPYAKDYVLKGEHAGEWVAAVNNAASTAFFGSPAATKVTVDQLAAIVRIHNDRLASVRNVINHLSLIRPLSNKAKKKIQEIVGRKWQEAREAKRERERHAMLLADLERRQAASASLKSAAAGASAKAMPIPSEMDGPLSPLSATGVRFGTI